MDEGLNPEDISKAINTLLEEGLDESALALRLRITAQHGTLDDNSVPMYCSWALNEQVCSGEIKGLVERIIKSGHPQYAREALVNPRTPREYYQRLAKVIIDSGNKMCNRWCAEGLTFGRQEVFPSGLDRTQFSPGSTAENLKLKNGEWYHLLNPDTEEFVKLRGRGIWKYRDRMEKLEGMFMPSVVRGEGFELDRVKRFGIVEVLDAPQKMGIYEYVANFHSPNSLPASERELMVLK